MKMVAEGVKTSRVAREVADEFAIDMPIVRQVDAVINEGRSAEEAYELLLNRLPSTEFEGVVAR
jgi:glycerol-3-phosphate dehydrogenase (NAD(P)+)